MSLAALPVRPDLSRRTALSKSEINTARFCETQAFYSRTDPRPWVLTPEMVFGSALDAAIELAVTAVRAGMPVPLTRCIAAGAAVAERDGQPVDLDELKFATEAFEMTVVPLFDWSNALTQHTIRVSLDGLGECEGHPDFVLGSTVLDCKSSTKAKSEADIYFAPEMGFYVALREAETGEPVEKVGYLTWVRLKRPYWQPLVMDVTDDLRAEGMAEAERQINRRRLMDVVAAKGADPSRYFSGPTYPKKCMTCAWSDVCTTGQRRLRRLVTEEESDGNTAA